MMIIDGKKEAEILRQEIKKEIDSLKSKNNKVPGLTVILIGDFAPSQIYVKNKEKSAKEVGINSNVIRYSKEVTEEEVLKKIEDLNNDTDVSGILVQLPLPPQTANTTLSWTFTTVAFSLKCASHLLRALLARLGEQSKFTLACLHTLSATCFRGNSLAQLNMVEKTAAGRSTASRFGRIFLGWLNRMETQ